MAEVILRIAALILIIGGMVFGRGLMKKSIELKYRGVCTVLAGMYVALFSGVVSMLTV